MVPIIDKIAELPPGIVNGYYEGPRYWIAKSRAFLLQDISKALLDPNIRIVGVWGASGVGKSTFLKQLEMEVHERKHDYDFDEVTMATVSRSPNWEEIQNHLGSRLGLKIQKETREQKAERLRERLNQKKKVLIILDDIWDKIDLKDLGIPFDCQTDIKLLVTSRDDQVLKVKMGSKTNFHLQRLEEVEAENLFEEIVGKEVTYHSKLLKQWAKECAGLPVLISTLAAALKALPSSEWDNALTELKRSKNLGFENFIEKSLDFNYRLINSDGAKSLFLLCSQLGVPIINIDLLVMLALGLRVLKGVYSIEEARERGKTLIKNLEASNLLENYSVDYVKIHDVMSDAALSVSAHTHYSLVIRNSKMLKVCAMDDLTRCKSISILCQDEILELPQGLVCPQLDMFVASAARDLNIPDEFFKHMEKLKVLIISSIRFHSLPSSIKFLNVLHTLYLNCLTIEDISIVGTLKTLQVLTFHGGYKISRIPKEIGELSNLRYFNLADCSSLQVIEPNVLGRLVNIEELLLPTCFHNWDVEGISNASLVELNNMPHLRTLEICVPNSALLPHNMPFQRLEQYKIYIGDMWFSEESSEGRALMLELASDSSDLILKESLQAVLKKTQDLSLRGWSGFEESFTELSKEGYPKLKHIHVECCSVQYIFHSKLPNDNPVLESMFLFYLTNLQKICKSDLPLNYLSNLSVIKIEHCDKLKNLFSSSLVEELQTLKEIEVSDCEMIQEIVKHTEMHSNSGEGGTTGDGFKMLELKRLRKLKLANLPSFSSFYCNGSFGDRNGSLFDQVSISFPYLESLTLCELPKLRRISYNQYLKPLRHLKSLELYKCDSLLYAVDSNLLQLMTELESLTIDNCDSMGTVFKLEELDATGCTPYWPPIMMKSKSILEVLKLEKLEVSKCKNLKYLFPSSMAKSLRNLSQISIASCEQMEEIILEKRNDGQKPEDVMEFKSLTNLEISNMKVLKAFSHGSHLYRFPSLTQLEVSSCPEMRTFVTVKHENDEAMRTEDIGGDTSFFNEQMVLPRLEKLVLCSLKSIKNIWGNKLSEGSVAGLASIEIKECSSLQSIFDSPVLKELKSLTKVELERCNLLEKLFVCEDGKLICQKLQEVRLLHLNNLERVVTKSNPSEDATLTFPSLRAIFVEDCGRLTSLLPDATARSLFELENMHISSCRSLKEVISFSDDGGNMAMTEPLRFKNLTSLCLRNLDNLVRFCLGNYELYFPFLKNLSILECMELKAFVMRPNSAGQEEQSQHISSTSNIEVGCLSLFDEKVTFPNLQELHIEGLMFKEIWPKNKPARFQMDLKELSVVYCNQLSTIIPSHMLPDLQSLESINVESCESVEVVVKLENNILRSKSTTKVLENLHMLTVQYCYTLEHIVAVGGDNQIGNNYQQTITFPGLSSLKLWELERLSSFCNNNHKIELPSLTYLNVNHCKAVKVLIADSIQDHKQPLLLVNKVKFPKMVSMIVDGMESMTELWHISKEDALSVDMQEAFCKLQNLIVAGCHSLLTLFPSRIIRAFWSLEKVTVMFCESLESVFESPRSRSEIKSKMKHVWDVADPSWIHLSFDKLYSVIVFGCSSLRHLFPASIARRLIRLHRLGVVHCDLMEEIIRKEGSTEDNDGAVEWPSLDSLQIAHCPKAKIFASERPDNVNADSNNSRHENSSTEPKNLYCVPKVKIPKLKTMHTDADALARRQFVDEICTNPTNLGLHEIDEYKWVETVPWELVLERFPKVATLEISGCCPAETSPSDNERNAGVLDLTENLIISYCYNLADAVPFLALFENLTVLTVRVCYKLSYLAGYYAARGLVQLTTLTIAKCDSLAEIVRDDRNEKENKATDDSDMISFPRLRDLRLFRLKSLRSFSSASCKFNFPSLRRVDMREVPEMDVFCKGDFTTPFKHRITRSIASMHNKEIEACVIPPRSNVGREIDTEWKLDPGLTNEWDVWLSCLG